MLVLLTVGIYEWCDWNGLRCNDTETKFHKFWFRHSKLIREIRVQTHRQQGDLENLILFFQKKKSRLKINRLKVTFFHNAFQIDLSGGNSPSTPIRVELLAYVNFINEIQFGYLFCSKTYFNFSKTFLAVNIAYVHEQFVWKPYCSSRNNKFLISVSSINYSVSFSRIGLLKIFIRYSSLRIFSCFKVSYV
jgi:hypothetical protein